MIPSELKSNVTCSTFDSTRFTIETNASMFSLLTSKVYNDPIAAVIREWSTNAIDACIAANKSIDFEVHIPTATECYFSVRDYGTGLEADQLTTLFCTLGASTKRNSNTYNGTFGIGRLSGLAYTSSFTVESYHGGYHHSYVISMQDGVPTAINLGTFPSTEPSGVRLTVTVNPNDIEKFETTCSSIYSYFSTKPTTTNVPLSYLKVDLSNDWFFHPTDTYDNYVLMANVLYEIPRILELSSYRCIKGTVFQIPTGAVSITPGRESLSMDTSTIKYVQELFTKFKDNIEDSVADKLKSMTTPKEQVNFYSSWSCRTFSSSPNILSFPKVQNARLYGVTSNFYLSINVPDSELKVLRTYSKKFKSCDSDIYTTNSYICIVDTKSYNFLLNKDIKGPILIITKKGKVDNETFIANAKKELDRLQLPYRLTSELAENTPDKDKPIPREGIYVSYINYHNKTVPQPVAITDPSETFYYIELSGYVPVDKELFNAACTAFTCLRTTLDNQNIVLVGVPKKYLDLIKLMPNFIPAKEALQTLLDTKIFFTAESVTIPSYITATKGVIDKCPKELYTMHLYDKSIETSTHISYNALNTMRKTFTIHAFDSVCPYSEATINTRYPLMYTLFIGDALGDKYIHYFNLETLNGPSYSPNRFNFNYPDSEWADYKNAIPN